MRLVLIVLLLLVALNTFLGDGRILRHIGVYQDAWNSLRLVFYVAGTLLLALMFIDIAFENFSRYPYDPPEEEDEPEEDDENPDEVDE
ncbi:MAG: hypothetical protein K8R90_11930 [Candidatus Cloacimonetes bacterium]|nr:hypothetical protein [Candidatus Cloacimonadota bacterium]